MKTPTQEALAQTVFWGSLLAPIASVVLFIAGFRIKNSWKAYSAFFLGGITLTQVLWYFNYLGASLGHVVGPFQPPQWHSYIPYGFAIAAVLAFFSFLARKAIAAELSAKVEPGAGNLN